MDFQLKKYNRNISNEEMIEDIKRVAILLNKNRITIDEYNENGKYHSTSLTNRFDNWPKVLQAANLDITRYKLSNEELIKDLKRVANILNKKSLTQEEYNEIGKYRFETIVDRFESWHKALKFANLDLFREQNISEEALFINILNIWEKLGRQPSYKEMKKPLSKYSVKPYINRFGTWYSALEKFIEYINDSQNYDEKSSIETNELMDENNHINKESVEINTELVEVGGTNEQNNEIAPKHKTKRDPNLRLRFLVMRKDGFKCVMCGKSPANYSGVELHIDHIMPWSKGGETVLENLQTLCSVCNIGKSNLRQ